MYPSHHLSGLLVAVTPGRAIQRPSSVTAQTRSRSLRRIPCVTVRFATYWLRSSDHSDLVFACHGFILTYLPLSPNLCLGLHLALPVVNPSPQASLRIACASVGTCLAPASDPLQQEPDDRRRKLHRPLDRRQVAAVLDHLEARARDAVAVALAVDERHEAVLPPPEDEGRRRDATEPPLEL